jgi:hypothetical protein
MEAPTEVTIETPTPETTQVPEAVPTPPFRKAPTPVTVHVPEADPTAWAID